MSKSSEKERELDPLALFSLLPPKKHVKAGYRCIYETEKPKETTNVHYVLFGTLANKEESVRIFYNIFRRLKWQKKILLK